MSVFRSFLKAFKRLEVARLQNGGTATFYHWNDEEVAGWELTLGPEVLIVIRYL